MKIQIFKLSEWSVAVLLTIAVLMLLFARATHAGGLWRDEAASVQLAEMPAITDLFSNFQRESFPAFFPLIVRAYCAVFGTTDTSFRAFGFGVGVLLLAVIWLNSLILSGSPPLVSLALLGLNSTFLIWGTTIRGYGVGSVFILLAFGLIAKLLLESTRFWIATSLLAALASVQVLLYNSVLLAAITAAVLAVCAMRQKLRPALATGGIAAVCAISMLPYLRPFWSEGQSTVVLQSAVTLGWFWSQLQLAFGDPSRLMIGVWITLSLASIAGAAIRLCLTWSEKPPPEWDLLLFGLLVSVVSVTGYLAFLKIISYRTREWYYLALLSILAGTIDLLVIILCRINWVRAARLAFAIAFLVGMPLVDSHKVIERQTNLDLVAQKLEEAAQPRDLIVVNPWFYGITFNRYYHGSTLWVTSPIMSDHRVHRFDLLKARMMSFNPIDDLQDLIGAKLKSGARVWFVGNVDLMPEGEAQPSLPPAPNSEFGWNMDAYAELWSRQLGILLQKHALTGQFVRIPTDNRVNELEDVPLLAVDGWRE